MVNKYWSAPRAIISLMLVKLGGINPTDWSAGMKGYRLFRRDRQVHVLHCT